MLVREYEPGDEEEIMELFEEAFKRPLDERFWRWRYLNNPYGKGIISLMYEGDKLVGHYAVIPIPLSIHGEVIKAALSMTTMTHPDYWKRDIFTTLATRVYSICEKENVKIVLGFANKNSYHGLTERLGWIGFGQIIYFESSNYEHKKTD